MISIRNAKFAKIGLLKMLDYIEESSGVELMYQNIFEIGSYVGDSTEIFARRFEHVISIDPFENGYDDNDPASYQHSMEKIEAQFNLLCKDYKNITKTKLKSVDAVECFEDNLFIVYIDGLHTYEGVKQDIELWSPKIRKGGWLTGHDYQNRFPGTIQAVNEFKRPDMIFKDTSWCIRV